MRRSSSQGPWNGNVGFFAETDPLFQALDAAMERVTAANGARFADVFPVFNPQGDTAAETDAICTLTLLCSEATATPPAPATAPSPTRHS